MARKKPLDDIKINQVGEGIGDKVGDGIGDGIGDGPGRKAYEVVEVSFGSDKPVKLRVHILNEGDYVMAKRGDIVRINGRLEYVTNRGDSSLRTLTYETPRVVLEITRNLKNKTLSRVYESASESRHYKGKREFENLRRILEREGIQPPEN